MKYQTGKKNNELPDATSGSVVTFATGFTLFSKSPLSAESDLDVLPFFRGSTVLE
jgi:hypothetical protein